MGLNILNEKLKDNSIKNEELYDCLISGYFILVGQAIYKIIERRYCDKYIIKALSKISLILNGYKVMGPYQIGHLAIAALYLVDDRLALKHFEPIYESLNDNDKFLVDNFVKGMNEKK